MNKTDILIVGGSAAGLTAALSARKCYPGRKITLVRREAAVLVPCGIPYIFGTLGTPRKNLIGDKILEDNAIDLIIDEAIALEPATKKVVLNSKQEIIFEKLVLATGSRPIVPKIPGATYPNVFTVRKDVAYLEQMLEALRAAENIVIIGGGFIGVELADEIVKLGDKKVTIVEMLSHCLVVAYEEAMGEKAEEVLKARGITLYTSNRVEAIEGNGRAEFVLLSSGERIKADVVILGIGTVPETTLAEKAGLSLGANHGIAVNSFMQTSHPDIFAIGDCAEKYSFFTGEPVPLRLASVATAEARIAGANLYGLRRRNPGTVGIFSTSIGGLALSAAGLTERQARQAGFKVLIGQASSPDRHPGSIPGAQNLTVKLVFHRDSSALIGGHVIGGSSTGEIGNILAVAIQKRLTAEDLITTQIGTHPLLTASPIAYPLTAAAETALSEFCE